MDIGEKLLAFDISTKPQMPFQSVQVEADEHGHPCPEQYREKVVVNVIHDGNYIPERMLHDDEGLAFDFDELLLERHRTERDWGAEMVSAYLASALALPQYHRIAVSRALMDFGRFPGSTPASAGHMDRYAINYPFSECLSFNQKFEVFETCYDVVSKHMDEVISNKLVKIAIHTYDEKNPSQSRRPAVSVLTRSHGHQHGYELPVGLFDPAFPDELAEFTADRLLRSRIALTLEEAGIYVSDNFPYTLPDGSVEVRSQVWYFFRHMRNLFEAEFPQAPHDPQTPTPRDLVWNMLLDTNLRSAESDALRSYIHMYRRPPQGFERFFAKARKEYDRIVDYINKDGGAIITSYRNSVQRPSSILIEVRKDLVVDMQGHTPIKLRHDDARMLARYLAKAVRHYLVEDLAEKKQALKSRDVRFT